MSLLVRASPRAKEPNSMANSKPSSTGAATLGEVFNTVSSQALTLKGYAESLYRWFGHEPRLAYLPFQEWLLTLDETYR
jgi:hypothetical protein